MTQSPARLSERLWRPGGQLPCRVVEYAVLQSQGPFGTHPSHIDPQTLDSWLAVGADGVITSYTGKCDFGQGMFTAQCQLVAEELCVSVGRINLLQCDTAVCPDQGTTSGSSIHSDKL
jgi:nicotinate dehydrogenase subunit B